LLRVAVPCDRSMRSRPNNAVVEPLTGPSTSQLAGVAGRTFESPSVGAVGTGPDPLSTSRANDNGVDTRPDRLNRHGDGGRGAGPRSRRPAVRAEPLKGSIL
jgi:hypothetical protein